MSVHYEQVLHFHRRKRWVYRGVHTFGDGFNHFKNLPAMQLICDSHHGIYCPQITVQSLIPEIVAQLPEDAVSDVLEGPDNEFYLESWEDVLNSTFTHDGKTCRLEQDEDVWMIEVRPDFEYTYHDERGEFKGWVSLNDETVFEFNEEIFEDGFMKHRDDLNGLMGYLIDLGIMTNFDNLIKA